MRRWGEKDLAKNRNDLSCVPLPEGWKLSSCSPAHTRGAEEDTGLVPILLVISQREPLEKLVLAPPNFHCRSLAGMTLLHT